MLTSSQLGSQLGSPASTPASIPASLEGPTCLHGFARCFDRMMVEERLLVERHASAASLPASASSSPASASSSPSGPRSVLSALSAAETVGASPPVQTRGRWPQPCAGGACATSDATAADATDDADTETRRLGSTLGDGGLEMAGLEMAGLEMTGHEMAGLEMAGLEMTAWLGGRASGTSREIGTTCEGLTLRSDGVPPGPANPVSPGAPRSLGCARRAALASAAAAAALKVSLRPGLSGCSAHRAALAPLLVPSAQGSSLKQPRPTDPDSAARHTAARPPPSARSPSTGALAPATLSRASLARAELGRGEGRCGLLLAVPAGTKVPSGFAPMHIYAPSDVAGDGRSLFDGHSSPSGNPLECVELSHFTDLFADSPASPAPQHAVPWAAYTAAVTASTPSPSSAKLSGKGRLVAAASLAAAASPLGPSRLIEKRRSARSGTAFAA